MRIDRAGWPFITGPLAPAAVLAPPAAGRRGGPGWRLAVRWACRPTWRCSSATPTGAATPRPPTADEVLSPADGVVMVAGEPQAGRRARRRLAAGERLPLRRRRARQPLARTAARSSRAPTARAASWPPTARSPRTGTSAASCGCATATAHRGLPADRRRPGPPDRHPHRPGPAAGHRRADGPDEVRLADGRLRAAGVHDHRDARGSGCAAARPSSPAGPRPAEEAPPMPPTRRTDHREFVRGSVRGTRRRALATLPSLFTLANMFCGFFAILVSIRGRVPAGRRPDRAVDHLRHHRRRGRPAGRRGHPVRPAVRLAGRPGVLRPGAGAAGVHAVLARAATSGTRWAGWPASSGWPAPRSGWPGSTRPIDPTADKRYFIGMPSPGAAGVVLASVFAFGDQMQGRDRLWVLLVVVVPALLMVSNIRFRSFRSLVSPKSGRPYGLIALAVVLVVGFALVPGGHRHRARLRLPAGPAAAPDRLAAGPAAADAAQGGPLVTRAARSARTTSRRSSAWSASSPSTRRRCTRCGSPRSS